MIVIGLSLCGLMWSAITAARNQSVVWQSAQRQLAAERLLSSVKDVETAYRGYVIVGSNAYLDPYREATVTIGQRLETLRTELGSDAPSDLIASIDSSVKQVMDYAATVIEARQRSVEEARAIVRTNRGKELMDGVRTVVEGISEDARLSSQAILRRNGRGYWALTIASLAGVLAAVAYFAYSAMHSRKAAASAKDLLRDVVARAPLGLSLVNSKLEFELANEAFSKLSGLAGNSGATARLSDVAAELQDPLMDTVRRNLHQSASQTPEPENETVEIASDEGARFVEASVFPVSLSQPDGRVGRGAGIVLQDVTAKRNWELELEHARDAAETANRAKSAFLANMSHELRTPLTAVLGYCELIEEDLRDMGADSVLTDLNKINVNARHLLSLINDVLDLSKIEAQKMDVHAVDFTVSTLLHELDAAAGSLVAKNGNQLVLTGAVDDTGLFTDDLKLKQILLNLLGNAAKFTTGGTITLDTAFTEHNGSDSVVFTVRDTGIGMTPEQLANLFQRFNQADQTTTRKYGGTGLGLALTHALASMLNGTITVQSAVGKGTTFVVTIPRHYQKRSVETDAALLGPQPAAEGHLDARQYVLVVDDEATARDLLTRHLNKEGFSVLTAGNGRDALDMIKAHRPIAVLLDVMMPELDGWHVLRSIKNDPELRDIPVIMQTVLDEEHFAYALGASSYLKKPVRRSELSDALTATASGRSSPEVLIVDDDVAACERLSKMLVRDGWIVTVCHNGKDALAHLAHRMPALVLADLIMPEMDGYAFIRQLRQNPAWDNIPVVVMTAADVQSKKVKALAGDTQSVVQKGAMPLADLVTDLRRYAKAGAVGTSGNAK